MRAMPGNTRRPAEVAEHQNAGTVDAENGTNEGPCVDDQTKRLSGTWAYTYYNSRAREFSGLVRA